MALKLEIKSISSYGSAQDAKPTERNLLLQTDEKTETLFLKSKNNVVHQYQLSLLNLSFQKKMYQPTEITVEIMFMPVGEADWFPIRKADIIGLFENKQVSLYDMTGVTTKKDANGNTTIVIPEKNKVGEDFYIYQAAPSFQEFSMCVKLTICSLDKLMTIERTSRTFVAKKLCAEIIEGEKMNYVKPYNNKESIACDNKPKILNYNNIYGKNNSSYKTEHIFPYLVQYDESFYDLLARTTNRWGEFLYYEDGKLHVGYSTDHVTEVKSFHNLSFIDLQDLSLNKSLNGASYDKNFIESNLVEDPKTVKGEMLFLNNGGWDKYLMRKLASFWKNDKSVPTFITNTALDDTLSSMQAFSRAEIDNGKFNKKYFEPARDDKTMFSNEHYGPEKDGKEQYCQFTEFDSPFTDAKYKNVLEKEEAAAKDAICIDFDTTYPGLKLGQIISVYDEYYIVVEIDCRPNHELMVLDDKWVVKNDDKPDLVYKVIATSMNTVTDTVCYKEKVTEDGKDVEVEKSKEELIDMLFYPVVLPSGHIRYSDSQVAIVTDVDDPATMNRVRVRFPWQSDAADPSPWLIYATNSAGLGVIGKHYIDSQVLVGFADGNVERPYVMGGLSLDADVVTSEDDIIYKTPGGQVFKLDDGDGKGLTAFLTGALSPITNTILNFLPISTFKDMPVTCLEGGFVLTDKYGVYKVTGSTDKREVCISSAWGNVKIDAFTGISISAPNGDISIKGKNVKIEAGNNLELISGTNVKYKIFGDNTPIVSDMLSSAAKKAIETFQPLDLSLVRSVFDIVLRPAEGKLRIKSNRYMMLESGKGACGYPGDAYSSQDVRDKLLAEDAETNIRPGVNQLNAMKQFFAKINDVGNKINRDYIMQYNECVDAYIGYLSVVQHSRIWANGFTNDNGIKICDTLADNAFKNKLWDKSKKTLSEADLGFADCYKASGNNDVQADVVTYYRNNRPAPPADDELIKADVISNRAERRARILESANRLKTAINAFLAAPELSKEAILTELNIQANDMPKKFKDSMVKAFSKKELGNDIFYFMDITDERKSLVEGLRYDADALNNQRKILKRKAALIFLQEMGFKDEWRQKINDPQWVAPHIGDQAVLPVPPVPQVSIPRKTASNDLQDDGYWNSFVDSLVAVPTLSKDQFAVTKAAADSYETLIEKMDPRNLVKSYSENNSWSNAKNGSILFSSDDNIYCLKGNIHQVNALITHNLKSADNEEVDNFFNNQNNGGVVNGVKTLLKGLD